MVTMLHDPKKTAMLIIAKGKDREDMSKHEDDDKEGRIAAAEEIISAVHSKDAEALEEALTSFWSQCENMEEEGDESEY